MDLVTYLLGAGASAQCIPVVKGLAERIKYFSLVLETIDTTNKFHHYIKINSQTHDSSTVAREIASDLAWLAAECEKHSSIDTFAKKLFIKKSGDYDKLKTTLSIYFTLEQKFRHPDFRYDNFWASIINEKDIFPERMRMVSWNYDFQLEQSYLNFSDDSTLMEVYETLNIRSFNNRNQDYDTSKFSVYKLNGSAIVSSERDELAYLSDDLIDEKNFYEVLFYRYKLINNSRYKKHLSFAWEHDLTHNYFDKLKSGIWETKVLVIIGYSFPYFNRKIDTFVINECMPFLEKVYFQAPDANNLKERFKIINSKILDKNLILVTDLDQFTFPNEL